MYDRKLAESLGKMRQVKAIHQQEVLRVAATLAGGDPASLLSQARRETLRWMQQRAGGHLPPQAWDQQSFELLSGGRTTLGIRLETEGSDLWAARIDDPDKTVPGRIWTTEISIGLMRGMAPRLGVRLLLSTPEERVEITPATPGCVLQIAKIAPMLLAGSQACSPRPIQIRTEDEAEDLVRLITDQQRKLPVIVATGDERATDPDRPLVNCNALARATMGLAHVVSLPARHTYLLSDSFGKQRSVFLGAVRVYMPGFSAETSPYDHRLFLGDELRRTEEADRCQRQLQSLVAAFSLRSIRVGQDVLSFSAVRSTALRLQQEEELSAGVDEGTRLRSAMERIEALQGEVSDAKAMEEFAIDEQQKAQARAEAAEAQLAAASSQIQHLVGLLKAAGADPDRQVQPPSSWQEFPDWADRHLAGRVTLTGAARRSIKGAELEDVALAARCLMWLAGPYRDRRMNGGGAPDMVIEEGIRNTPCGSDAFEFDWQRHRLMADWHVKTGGNTRDPRHCLRIYYAFEPNSGQVVIADMPGHRRTGAT